MPSLTPFHPPPHLPHPGPICLARRVVAAPPERGWSAAPRNGLHDWLNRLTIALAKKHRIGVADVTDAVMAFAPAARGIRDAPGLRSPEGDYILPCRPAVATLLAAVAQRVCSGCGRPWG
jgi:hypothetical protein